VIEAPAVVAPLAPAYPNLIASRDGGHVRERIAVCRE